MKVNETAVEMTDVMDGASDLVQKVEAPLKEYPFITRLQSHWRTLQRESSRFSFSPARRQENLSNNKKQEWDLIPRATSSQRPPPPKVMLAQSD